MPITTTFVCSTKRLLNQSAQSVCLQIVSFSLCASRCIVTIYSSLILKCKSIKSTMHWSLNFTTEWFCCLQQVSRLRLCCSARLGNRLLCLCVNTHKQMQSMCSSSRAEKQYIKYNIRFVHLLYLEQGTHMATQISATVYTDADASSDKTSKSAV